MSWRSSPPFRADHVGSLLRPKALLEARASHAQGAISAEELREIEDRAIEEAVRRQEELGLQAVTDGEFRRGSWHMDFLYQIGGVSRVQEALKVRFHNAQGDIEFTPAALEVNAPLHLSHCIFAPDFTYLKSLAHVVPKLTIPSPSMLTYRGGRAAVDRAVYPEMAALWSDLSRVYAEQIAALWELGCTYLQLDDTSLAYLNDPVQRDYVAGQGGDPQNQHRLYIDLINRALAGRPAGMAVCVHLCRGNFRSSWVASGGYDYVAEALFSDLNVDGYFLEYDDDRSGGFEPLRFVPKGKFVVLGLVTSKRPALESKDVLKRRVAEAARYIPGEQLCLGPQCGFSSTQDGNALSAEEQFAKLRLVVQTARELWG